MGYIRFLLAAVVLVTHAGGGLPAMRAGGAVEAFFVISGFYMGMTYEKHYGGPHGVWRFYASRYLRLYPLYCVALALMAVIYPLAVWQGGAINQTHSFDFFAHPQDWLQNGAVWSLFGQDLLAINPERANALPIRQAWSISAELIFYLLTPLLLPLGRTRLLAAAAALLGLKYLLLQHYGLEMAYFPFFSQIGYFVLGLAIYRFREQLTFRRSSAIALGFLFCAMAVSRLDLSFENPASPFPHLLLIAALCACLSSLVAHVKGRIDATLGDLSYGVYILHFAVIDLLRMAPMELHRSLFTLLALAVTTALSLAFELSLQKRLDHWRRQHLHSRVQQP